MVSLKDIKKANDQLKGVVHCTPLDYSLTFSNMADNDIYLKLENLQKTGSFKVRGSYNKMHSLEKEELKNGVVAASAGNHAQGVAYASKMLGIPCTIVMPTGAPISKVQATEAYGAEIILHGASFDDALAYALDLRDKREAKFIHPFDDPAIIIGQGTIGLEILEQISDVDAVVCPVGGGGLIAGVAAAMKEKNPHLQIYGIEAEACPSMSESLKQNQLLTVDSTPTMADGIAVKRPGQHPFELAKKYVDGMFTVDEEQIAKTMLLLLERNKLLVEGSGAVSLAALLHHKLPIKNKKVVAILSGGNVDVSFISRIIERGMVEAGRVMQFKLIHKDRPGNLEKILRIISEQQANIIDISLNRIGDKIFPNEAQLSLTLETKNKEHIDDIYHALMKNGYHPD
ncbi:threonine ammonia-lyase [Oceanobacillus piezotolerans]|uniref:L-threonine dehydratase catabolic TdcB n=1 Tax=Oceanobacillus piezotolerans TaxID=2448030 RepID=A0A498DHA1_9BACI|nr:threonine ammonia-lyase [Oceanobacillus piezotolerans]RLL44865.1 threonine ammonia-lyase [Oceanobacillus piezotolerans]